MKNTKNILWALPLLSVLFFSACEKDDPIIPNEEELITTLIYSLTPDSGGTTIEFWFKDVDGDGGQPPMITSEPLMANTGYTGVLMLVNETITPPENVTEEIEEEALEHQFFFTVDTVDMSISYADEDGEGNPVGIYSTLQTGAATTGTLTITLRHEPDKTAAGVADGDITNAGGETDIEVTFDVTVQ